MAVTSNYSYFCSLAGQPYAQPGSFRDLQYIALFCQLLVHPLLPLCFPSLCLSTGLS